MSDTITPLVHLRLSITNTLFRHKGVHMCTWHQDALGRRSMIDFVVVSSDLQPYFLDTRVKRETELSTDHHLVESFDHVPGEVGDIESEWTMFRASIVEVADRWPQGGWCLSWRQCPNLLVDTSGQAECSYGGSEAKTRAWEEFGEAMGNDFRTASKRFWTTIQRLRKGKQCRGEAVNTVYSGDGVLLTSTRDVVDRWKEYFEDLLNPTNAPSSEEVGPGDTGTGTRISGAEVAEKGDRRVCSNYGGITLLSLPGKVYSGVLERKVHRIVEPRIQVEQCGFRPGRGTVDQLYTLSRVFEGAWEFAQPVHMCFKDLEKAFDRVPREVLWGSSENDVVLLASSARDLQRSLDWFAAAREAAGMKISTSKRKTVECLLRVKEQILPQVEEFKYLGVLFTSEGRMEQEIDRLTGVADRVRSSAIREELGVEPLLLRIERSQMGWLGHLVRMPPGRLPGKVFRACPSGCCPRDLTPDKR
ncbi:hypothetical protein D4764_20G0008320 [Takifugu flavidus]|uniref:Uncharacterized protein n=1 Tax=Takifugu flavidus TaxID=433684 RepID=A0A5C6NL36_9TELE|nr:hypothetical protein D4764_20G0008320 [Takifugu flavidus]